MTKKQIRKLYEKHTTETLRAAFIYAAQNLDRGYSKHAEVLEEILNDRNAF